RGVILTEKDKKLGSQVLAFAFPKNENTKDASSPSGYKLSAAGNEYYLDQFLKDPNIIRSYGGANYKSGYKFDPDNIKITVVKENITGNEAKITIQSGGKDNPTPMTLKRNKLGQWKIFGGFGSMATGVRRVVDDGDF
ncbi:MAG: DUF6935 domain-containing protein, partial [Promethearchaeota archaeon]